MIQGRIQKVSSGSITLGYGTRDKPDPKAKTFAVPVNVTVINDRAGYKRGQSSIPAEQTLTMSDLRVGDNVVLHGPPKGPLHSIRKV